jgi:hypothetical protein
MELLNWAISQFFPPIALGITALLVRRFLCEATYVGSDLFFGVSIVYLLFALDSSRCGELLNVKIGSQIIILSIGLISIASSVIMLMTELRLEHSQINLQDPGSHILHRSSTQRARRAYAYCWIFLSALLLLCIVLITYKWVHLE